MVQKKTSKITCCSLFKIGICLKLFTQYKQICHNVLPTSVCGYLYLKNKTKTVQRSRATTSYTTRLTYIHHIFMLTYVNICIQCPQHMNNEYDLLVHVNVNKSTNQRSIENFTLNGCNIFFEKSNLWKGLSHEIYGGYCGLSIESPFQGLQMLNIKFWF